ncbi:protein of unknown function [Bartonella clarridgeiae 73]|uniref:Uncharacterized protein n=1 Tax=Bartonella clarridgeiae (strain CCUG 45776 / CIP 104772 / 73) TaxID=696125 RepID=E6YGM5_BARC7|nr:protein of unknown function [Bartonella clarridgeiae 73]
MYLLQGREHLQPEYHLYYFHYELHGVHEHGSADFYVQRDDDDTSDVHDEHVYVARGDVYSILLMNESGHDEEKD